jgi:Family of unknown function (DUF5677)
MSELETDVTVGSFLRKYGEHVWAIVERRNEPATPVDLYHGQVPSVLAGLLARQAALSIRLAECPRLWDGHISPMILRSMVECLITFRWIVADPIKRATEYVSYGLGQAKLSLSHTQKALEAETDPETKERLIWAAKMQEAWIVSQKLMLFVDINFGSWSGSSIRQMCDDIGDDELYRFYFVPFSGCVHSTWQHVSIFNTNVCRNPLHMEHFVSALADPGQDPMQAQMSARFFDWTVVEFDTFYDLQLESVSAESYFRDGLMEALTSGKS